MVRVSLFVLGVNVRNVIPGPAPPPPGPSPVIEVKVDWTSPIITTNTAATVEVDVMPFLGEANWGGPYKAYHAALANLGAEYVRFAPWFANPRVVVPELTPHVCNATHPSTNWNSTYFDGVMADFQSAVCGPEAAQGICKLSVVQQLSTMPEYMCKHRLRSTIRTCMRKPHPHRNRIHPIFFQQPKSLRCSTCTCLWGIRRSCCRQLTPSELLPPPRSPPAFIFRSRCGWRLKSASNLPVEHHVSL